MSEDFKMVSFGYQTLKLDAAYRPIDVISGVEALVMCIVGKAKAIESYEAAQKIYPLLDSAKKMIPELQEMIKDQAI